MADDEISKSVQEIDTVTDGATGDTNQYKRTSTVKEDTTIDIEKNHLVLSEVLGGLPLRIGITIVLLYHLLYITYNAFKDTRTDLGDAFFETRTNDTVAHECFCNQRDQIVYRVITFTLMGAWIIFIPAFALHKTFSHFTCTNRVCCKGKTHEDYQKIKELFEKYNSQIELRKIFFRKEVNDMITTYYLDSEHYNSKKLKLEANRRKNLKQKNEEEKEERESEPNEIDAKLNVMNWKQWCSCTKHCGFMFFKVIFILIRLGFRLAVIPLFQLHWLDDYAWNCIFNKLIRKYCKTVRNEYFIGLDHSLVIYVMYVLILLAILFSIIINWFPKGIPNIILNFEGNFNALTIRVDDGNKQNNIRK